jgi:hypothetical protein
VQILTHSAAALRCNNTHALCAETSVSRQQRLAGRLAGPDEAQDQKRTVAEAIDVSPWKWLSKS